MSIDSPRLVTISSLTPVRLLSTYYRHLQVAITLDYRYPPCAAREEKEYHTAYAASLCQAQLARGE